LSFHVLDAAYDLLRAVRTPLATVKAENGPLADQLTRAVSSVPLNIAEGSAHKAKSRAHYYRIGVP
jgi:four helix bundle protein